MSDDDAELAELRKRAEVALVELLRAGAFYAFAVWALGLVRGLLVATLITLGCRVLGKLVLRCSEWLIDSSR